jgi:hypothetical protein
MKTRSIHFNLEIIDPATQVLVDNFRVRLVNEAYDLVCKSLRDDRIAIISRTLLANWINSTYLNPYTAEVLCLRYLTATTAVDRSIGARVVTCSYKGLNYDSSHYSALKERLVNDYFPIRGNILTITQLPDIYL